MNKQKKTIKPLGPYWFQKMRTDKRGLPIYTYHYRRKNEKPSKLIIWDTRRARQYRAYHALDKDLRETLYVLKEYKKRLDRLGDHPTIKDTINVEKIILKALMKSIVISYGKCFVETKGRSSKLERANIKLHKNLKMHDFIMELRHQYVAHPGISEHEQSRIVAPIPPLKALSEEYVYLLPPISELSQTIIDRSFAENYYPLVAEVLEHVENKINKLDEDIMQELNALGRKGLKELLKACGNKSSIIYTG